MKNNGPNGNHKNYITRLILKNVSKKQQRKRRKFNFYGNFFENFRTLESIKRRRNLFYY